MDEESDSPPLDNTPSEAEQHLDRRTEPVDLEQPPRLPFPVVGIGASAGGLEACTEFFMAMPTDSGMSFVVIQHLPPDRESMVADILQRTTAMKVSQVQDQISVEPNHVYIIRPGHTMTIKDGRLHLGERLEKPRHARPIDDFFKSLAEEQRQRAICIILSGMGSNGAAGAQAIKAVGGLCIAQEPETAQFPSMPRHLIDAGYADFILRVEEMPDALIAYARHPYASQHEHLDESAGDGEKTTQDAARRQQQHLREILAIVRTRTRFDFNGYKKPTVLRRIQRRMGLNRVTEIDKYAKILRQSPVEVSALADDLLIHVTGFFRDPQSWEILRQRVIVPLVRAREPDGVIRCWVAACSSGEEAYSLAMLLVEESERAGKPLNIKVFATDTAERTLANARNGVFPGGIEAEISPERLQRFFDKDDGLYRVRQDLRERVVFAPQNLLSDPPFSRLDIVTCRNLLIYLEPDVQQRVFDLVHFGLREGGALFLGSSETVSATAGLFEPIDKKARIYRRVGPTRHGTMDFPVPRGMFRDSDIPSTRPGTGFPSVAQLTARALLALHVPAAVTVDRNCRVVYYQGDTKPYLGQPTGEPTQDLITLVHDEVRGAVQIALQRAMSTGAVQTAPDGWVPNPQGKRRRVVVTASPLSPGEGSELFVISFQEHEETQPAHPGSEDVRSTPGQSSEDFQRLRDELQSTIEELQASNEEHKAAAQEAMSINEELQSSNEELETSKEEMQSLNEELATVNSQLHAKMEELQKTSGDLRSLLSSTDIAVIFLDPQFRIRRYTPAARNLLDLISTDIGRPLSDLAKKFTDPDLLEDAQAVLERLVPSEKEVLSDSGRWYARRVLPYRTVDDRIEGVVITFVDISDRKRAQDLAARAGEVVAEDLKAMDSLHNVSNLLIAVKDMHGVLREVLDAAMELQQTDLGEVRVCDHATATLKIAEHRGLSSEFIEACKTVDLTDPQAPWAQAIRQRTSVYIDDIENDLFPKPLRERCIPAGVRAMHCFPLETRGGELLGVLSTYYRQPRSATERWQRVIDLLVRQGSDTIERMRAEEDLARLLRSEQVARRALDDAARMKDEFLATLSHELRTPLSAILLWSKILRDVPLGEKEMKEGIDSIVSSAQTQARLVEDLLDTSRIAMGKLGLKMAETDLVEVVRAAIEQNDPAARSKGVRVESDLSPRAGLVFADPVRIQQVVWNLLSNAVKFTPPGGKINVALARKNDDVEITISDTGAGIAPDFLPYVFDRFRQYDSSVTRKYGGLGLGLAISKQLVELHGGTIRAQSPGIDRGATFTVNLPLPVLSRRAAPRPQTPPPPDASSLEGITVLLVEDEPRTRDVLSIILRQAGAIVTMASSGEEALAAYRQSRPQMVLTDIGLPDFDGYALLQKIRAVEAEHKMPPAAAVALTAYAHEEDRQKAEAAGFKVHLSKPVEPEKLVAALASLKPAR